MVHAWCIEFVFLAVCPIWFVTTFGIKNPNKGATFGVITRWTVRSMLMGGYVPAVIIPLNVVLCSNQPELIEHLFYLVYYRL